MRSVLLLAVVASCMGCSDLFAFDVERSIPEQRVSGNVVSGLLQTLLPVGIPLNVDLEAEQAAQGTGPVQRVSVSRLSFEITETGRSSANDVDDFDFVDSVEIFVASSNPDSSLERVLVAELPSVPEGAERIDLQTTGVNIRAHVEEGALIESSAMGTIPPDDVSFDGEVVLTLDVL